ncbi:MAG: hypothetical protein KBB11_04880 [Bacteroidales bacterium]|nr:hypothetical protein [Bacteroidales bacterium]HOY40185.1 hypothetical protein [Bacteroidales bacterium]
MPLPKPHNCRPYCAACCTEPSISSPIPGMPKGKRAGERCIHLTTELLCDLIDSSDRPEVCTNFNFDPIICGDNREEALRIMAELEG